MKFRIVLRRIHFRNNMLGQGSDEVRFLARATGVVFDLLRGLRADITHIDHYDFPEDKGFVEVDSGKAKEITMRFSCLDANGQFNYGEIKHTLAKPFKPRDERLNTTYYVLDWTVETALGRGAPKDIQACRQDPTSITCTTASGSEFPLELEAHCVIPSPVHKPGKFTVSKWASSIRNQGPISVSPGDPINVIPNPSAVPLLDRDDATADTCARIQVTYYKPKDVRFRKKDMRLQWSCTPITGGQVDFLGPPNGLEVLVYGTQEGEALLEVKLKGQVLDKYRVLIVPVKRIKCRVTILNGRSGGKSFTPRSTPARIRDHFAIANRFLRQLAVELVLHGDDGGTDGAQNLETGIYQATVDDDLTRKVSDNSAAPTRVNNRADCFNIVYLKSDHTPGKRSLFEGANLGVACAIPGRPAATLPVPCINLNCGIDLGSEAKGLEIQGLGLPLRCPDCLHPNPNIIERRRLADRPNQGAWDTGTPATSRHPGKDGEEILMILMPESGQLVGMPLHAALYITDANGKLTTNAMLKFGNTLAHEFGHCLGLVHRIEGGSDGGPGKGDRIEYPPNENVMHWVNGPSLAQDFDIIQVKGTRFSPILEQFSL